MKYILYAIGEILLITIGVLIAVNINKKVVEIEHQGLRCQYLEELEYTFEYDIKDVKENIHAFNVWNPKISALLAAIEERELSNLDSLENKISTVRRFIFFGQRTKTKMEELKYSTVDLIGNRELKNKLLLYQDEQIAKLLTLESRYNVVDQEVREYYSKHLYGDVIEAEKLENDEYFRSLLRQKITQNALMRLNYEGILEKQIEIKELIEQEKSKNCES